LLIYVRIKKIVRGSIYVFASFVIASFFTYLSRILLARYLGPVKFGTFSIALMVTYLFTAFAIAGVGTSITYFMSKEKSRNRKNAFFSALFVVSAFSLVIFSLIIIIFPKVISNVFGDVTLSSIAEILATFTFLYGITRVVYSILRGEEKSKPFAVFYSLAPTIYFIFIILFKAADAREALLLYIVAYLLTDLFLFPYVFKKVKFVKPDFSLVKQAFSFSIVLFLVEIIFSLRRWTDVWMLSLLSTVKNVGYYNAAFLSAFALNMTLTAINFLYLPVTNRLYNNGKFDILRETYTKICFILTFVVAPFSVALVLFAPQFIIIVFGKAYLPAAAPFSILMISTLVNVMFGPNWTNLIVKQEKKLLISLSSISLGINIILNYLTIPIWGIVGAAASTATSMVIWNIMTTVAIWKSLKMTPFSEGMFKTLLVSLVVALPFVILKYFVSLSILWAIIFGVAYLILYALAVDKVVMKINNVISFILSLH
jgi:O-antigen/teichoic acid export membrane protein